LILIRAKEEDVSELQNILELYGQCSGQMINKLKSAILFSTNTPVGKRSEVKNILEVDKETMS
jgi:DNA/RNA endonuclease YhcR with UshA esterase domain